MNKLPKFLIGCSIFALMPAVAGAAGTYYTGNYQSPQQRYSNQSYAAQRGGTFTQNGVTYNRVPQGGYSSSSYASTRSGAATRTNATSQQKTQSTNVRSSSKVGNGFTIGGGITHEAAMWKFEMKDSGSILRYDDVSWNVLDLHGAYAFDVGSMALKVDAGFKYGMQSGEASMTDDDITNGGGAAGIIEDVTDGKKYAIANQALSAGGSKDGNMLGFNFGVGLPDIFKIGNIKFTPSVGYRYLKYKLETKNNYGLSIETVVDGQQLGYCVESQGMTQCSPLMINGDLLDGDLWDKKFWVPVVEKEDSSGNKYYVPGIYDTSSANNVDVEGTYYFGLSGTSHSYEVEWSGPYIAMDMLYDINPNNAVSGRVELGFPGYTATGDQPYRTDWAHSKSVEDKADMFSAVHFGLGANWTTALTDMLALSLGVTYDYYKVSDADATTYLNPEYWNGYFDRLQSRWDIKHPDNPGADNMLNGVKNAAGEVVIEPDEEALLINQYAQDGWKVSQKKEIESFYKSLGIRLGLVARF